MKDRSFIHRQRQSRQAKADNLQRFPHVADPYPKTSMWTTFVAFIKRFAAWFRA